MNKVLEIYGEKTAWCACEKPNGVWVVYKKESDDELKYKGQVYVPEQIEDYEGIIVRYMWQLIKLDDYKNS